MAGHYIMSLWFLSFFPRLFSAVTDWMSTTLPHMMWPWREFRMQVWNVLHAARWNTGRKKIRHLSTIAQLCRAISSQLRHVSTIGKIGKQKYLLHMPSQHGELRPTSGWNRLTSLGYPIKFQRVSRLGCVIAATSLTGGQPNCAMFGRLLGWYTICTF